MIDLERVMGIIFVKLYSENFLEKIGVKGRMNFICDSCRNSDHDNCKGAPNGDSTWCDCAHK